MSSKIKSIFHWRGGRKPLIIILAILVLTVGVLFIIQNVIKADVNSAPPTIVKFTAPTTVDDNGTGDYLIQVQVNNVENISTGISDNTQKPNACILSAGAAIYPLYAASGKTSIPLTTIHRKDFVLENGNIKYGFNYLNKETITLNCLNSFGAIRGYQTIQSTGKGNVSETRLEGPTLVQPNTPFSFSWTTLNPINSSQVCAIGNLGDQDFIRKSSGSAQVSGITSSKSYTIACKNKKDSESLTFVSGLIVYVSEQKTASKWSAILTVPAVEIKPNTDFEINYSVEDSKGKTLPIANCKASGDWSGELMMIDGKGKQTIKGWPSGAKTFTLECRDNLENVLTPVSKTVTVVETKLQFTVNGKDPKNPKDAASFTNSNNYQPTDKTKPIVLSWDYKGKFLDTCILTSKDANGKTNIDGVDGSKTYPSTQNVKSNVQIVDYTMTCGKKEVQTIRVLPINSLIFDIITGAGYEHVSKTGDTYTLTKSNFALSWNLDSKTSTTTCVGTIDAGTVVDTYGKSWGDNTALPGSGRKLMNINSKTATISLQCDASKKTLTLINNSTGVIPPIENPPSTPTPPSNSIGIHPTGPFTYRYLNIYNNNTPVDYIEYPLIPIQYTGKNVDLPLQWTYTGKSKCKLTTETLSKTNKTTKTTGPVSSSKTITFPFKPTDKQVKQTLECEYNLLGLLPKYRGSFTFNWRY